MRTAGTARAARTSTIGTTGTLLARGDDLPVGPRRAHARVPLDDEARRASGGSTFFFSRIWSAVNASASPPAVDVEHLAPWARSACLRSFLPRLPPRRIRRRAAAGTTPRRARPSPGTRSRGYGLAPGLGRRHGAREDPASVCSAERPESAAARRPASSTCRSPCPAARACPARARRVLERQRPAARRAGRRRPRCRSGRSGPRR